MKKHVCVAVLCLLAASRARAQEPEPSEPTNGTRLFFGATARTLPKGQVYFGDYAFLLPFVQVGVTDRVSVGAGTPVLFGLEESYRPFWVTPKVQVLRTDDLAVAAGALHVFTPSGGGGGVAYVVATQGSERGSVTVGAGMPYTVHGERSAVVMVGGDRAVRKGLRVMTENYFSKFGTGMASAGVRFTGKLSVDVGFGVTIGLGETIAFPILNFAYTF